METLPDITVNIPLELLDSFVEVIQTGLRRTNKIAPEEKKSLKFWWEAEYDLIQSEIEKNKIHESRIK